MCLGKGAAIEKDAVTQVFVNDSSINQDNNQNMYTYRNDCLLPPDDKTQRLQFHIILKSWVFPSVSELVTQYLQSRQRDVWVFIFSFCALTLAQTCLDVLVCFCVCQIHLMDDKYFVRAEVVAFYSLRLSLKVTGLKTVHMARF